MVSITKKITASFYRLDSNKEPVWEWLLELSRDDRRIIGKDIQKVEFGWPIGMPYSRKLEKEIWEVRSSLSGGRIARILFTIQKQPNDLVAWLYQKNTNNT